MYYTCCQDMFNWNSASSRWNLRKVAAVGSKEKTVDNRMFKGKGPIMSSLHFYLFVLW